MFASFNQKSAKNKLNNVIHGVSDKSHNMFDNLKIKMKQITDTSKDKASGFIHHVKMKQNHQSLKKSDAHSSVNPEVKEFSYRAVSDITKIDLSSTSHHVKNTKNFVVLVNGFPARNKIYTVQTDNPDKKGEHITIPLMRTNHYGVLHILAEPHFTQNNEIDLAHCEYRPVKFSKRLGFVFKDSKNFNPKNIFYKKKFISKYSDIGLSEHFIRSMVLHSDNGEKKVDVSENPVIHNWLNVVAADKSIRDDYKTYNTHTERTKKALKYTDYAYWGTMGVGATALITAASVATAGAASVTSLGIGGGFIAAGSAIAGPDHHMKNNPADISRERDTQISALKTMKPVNSEQSQEHQKNIKQASETDKIQYLKTDPSLEENKSQPVNISHNLSDIQSGKIDINKNIKIV